MVTVSGLFVYLIESSARCSLVTVDKASGQQRDDVLRTLATCRARVGRAFIGENLVHDVPGAIAVENLVNVEVRR